MSSRQHSGATTPRLGAQQGHRAQGQAPMAKPAYPSTSPWRAKQQGPAPLVDAVLRSSQGTPGPVTAASLGKPHSSNGHGLNLPSLPRLGSQNTTAVPHHQTMQHQHVQGAPGLVTGPIGSQAQVPSTSGLGTPAKSASVPVQDGYASPGYGLRAPGPTFVQVAQQGMSNKPPTLQSQPRLPHRSESSPSTSSEMLNGVNSHMMPSMSPSSSLNTVLPGLEASRAPSGGHPGVLFASGSAVSFTKLPQTSLAKDELPAIGTGAPGQPQAFARNMLAGSLENGAPKTDMDRYGIKSLLSVMKMDGGDSRAAAAMGSDMSHLGLNLGGSGSENLSRTFASPWGESASRYTVVPDFRLPESFHVATIVPQQQKLQSLNEETLFYIFYTMPRDAMQEAAAVELTNRNWRYHKGLKMWLTKDPLSEPVQTASQAESGIYIFFDPTAWEKVKKEYVLYYPDIA